MQEVNNGKRVYHSTDFDEIFGFNTITEIRDCDRAASYIAKYITKTAEELPFKTILWHNRGLQKTKKIKMYHVTAEKLDIDTLYTVMNELSSTTEKGAKLFKETIVDTASGVSRSVGASCLINKTDMPLENITLLFDDLLGEEESNERIT